MFYANQYNAMSTPDVIQGVGSPPLASIDSNSTATGLQFLHPNQMSNNAHLLQFVKENNATLNFPQMLMLLLSYVDNERDRGNHITCISWVRDGHAFVIKDRKELVDNLLPLFFREGKFSSFTRKLYRWGFRQICVPKGGNKRDRDLLFGHEHFQRDNKGLVAEMRSVTAAGTRRAITAMTNKKKARKSKEKDGNRKSSPALVSAPPDPVPTVETKTHVDRVTSTSDTTKPQSLVEVHLQRLLGGSAAKSVATMRETPFQAPQSMAQNPRTQSALDALLRTRTIPTGDNKQDNLAQVPFQTPPLGLAQNPSTQSALDALLKTRTIPTRDNNQDNLVQTHLERLLGGSHNSPKRDADQDNLVQSHLERLLGTSHTAAAARTSPTRDTNQDNLVQSHLERLLGGSHTTTTARTSRPTRDTNQDNLVQSHLERLLGGSHAASTTARTSPTREINQENLVQSHLERLLNGSHTTIQQANPKPQTPFQTPGVGQNSAQSGYGALLKAKTHSLMPPPVQNNFLGLNDTKSLQKHVNYLKAMSQQQSSSSMAVPSPASHTGSLMQQQQPSLSSFDVGARLQALRQMSATTTTTTSKQQVGSSSQRNTVPTDARMGRRTSQSSFSQASMSSLPKSYLDLIQASGSGGGLVGKPAGVGSLANLILPESSASRNNVVMNSSSSDMMIGSGPSIIGHDGIFSQNNARWS